MVTASASAYPLSVVLQITDVVNGTDAQLLLIGANDAGKSERLPGHPKRSQNNLDSPKNIFEKP